MDSGFPELSEFQLHEEHNLQIVKDLRLLSRIWSNYVRQDVSQVIVWAEIDTRNFLM